MDTLIWMATNHQNILGWDNFLHDLSQNTGKAYTRVHETNAKHTWDSTLTKMILKLRKTYGRAGLMSIKRPLTHSESK